MRISKINLYILFGLNCLCGLAILIYLLTKNQASQKEVVRLNEASEILLNDSSQHTYLISYDAIDIIQVKKPYLIVGVDSLEYQTITFAGHPLYIPVKSAVWQNYWAGLLGRSALGKDDQRWEIAQQKWKAFVQPELDSLKKQKGSDTIKLENQLCHTLIKKVVSSPAQTFYVRDKMLEGSSTLKKWVRSDSGFVQIQESGGPINESSVPGWLLSAILLGASIGGIFYTRFAKPAIDLPEVVPPDLGPAEVDQITETPNTNQQPDFDQEAEATRQYVQRFVERYGDFYQKLENLPEPLTDEKTRMAIRRQLVEMALHAQSFTRAYILAKMQRPQGEPNLLLITNKWQVDQLDTQSYKVFTDDPYTTNKRYRLLQHILAEMNIGNLDGALLHDIYLPAEFLVQP